MADEYSEFDLIHLIKKKHAQKTKDLKTGIGDDCAVIEKNDDSVYLVTTDALVEGVHFTLKNFSYQDIGHKALAVNLSDIAAMGGVPKFYFVSLGLPKNISKTHIEQIYQGMGRLAGRFKTALAGGNVSRSTKGLWLSITVIGEAKKNQYKLRQGARVGDGIYVSGVLGAAALGLRILSCHPERQRRISRKQCQEILRFAQNDRRFLVLSQQCPDPRIKLGQLLAKQKTVHAMMDVSDGLVQDLGHICAASKVSAVINYDAIPRVKNFTKICESVAIDAREILLAGGEDYELLFTMSDRDAARVSKLASKIGECVTRIGDIGQKCGGARVKILGQDLKRFTKLGFDHLR